MSDKLNGSTARLAAAFGEVVEEAVAPLRQEIRESEERLANRIDRAVEDIVAEKQRERVS